MLQGIEDLESKVEDSYIDVWEINKTVPIAKYIVEGDCGIFVDD